MGAVQETSVIEEPLSWYQKHLMEKHGWMRSDVRNLRTPEQRREAHSMEHVHIEHKHLHPMWVQYWIKK